MQQSRLETSVGVKKKRKRLTKIKKWRERQTKRFKQLQQIERKHTDIYCEKKRREIQTENGETRERIKNTESN